jgi:signal transduction histidine kinase
MNGLIGMTDLLLDTPRERTQRDPVDTIRASSDAPLTVINDVLDFTKIEAGKLEATRLREVFARFLSEGSGEGCLLGTVSDLGGCPLQ